MHSVIAFVTVPQENGGYRVRLINRRDDGRVVPSLHGEGKLSKNFASDGTATGWAKKQMSGNVEAKEQELVTRLLAGGPIVPALEKMEHKTPLSHLDASHPDHPDHVAAAEAAAKKAALDATGKDSSGVK